MTTTTKTVMTTDILMELVFLTGGRSGLVSDATTMTMKTMTKMMFGTNRNINVA